MAVLKASQRGVVGTRPARRLRAEGKIPCVIYGHGQEVEPVALDKHDLELAVHHGERLLEVDVKGKVQTVLIKEVQYDTFGLEVVHVDFARVNLDELVEVRVEIVLKGTPVGVAEGGVLQQVANDVHLECAVKDIPEKIVATVTSLKIGDHLTMGDLPLPAGAKLMDDPETIVANINVVVEKEVVEVADENAQPEVIGAKPEEEEGEE